jgi:transposase
MSKTYREWNPDQTYLFPPSPRDWLPEDDLVFFLLDTVATLDMQPFYDYYEREQRGQPPYHPRLLVTLLFYCYATGTRSSRKIMRRCQTDLACRILVGEDIPDFRTLSDFRKLHLERLEQLFVEVLKLCGLAGLSKLGTLVLDGSKVKANASRHKAMSYEYMEKEEQRLQQEVQRLLAEAQASDAAEDAEHGDRRGDELPEELARREQRLAKIQAAKAALAARARAEAEADAAQRAAQGKPPRPTPPEEATPAPKDQYNFTDPESRIMKSSNKGWDQCGNAQVVVTAEQIIVAADVTDQANDKQQLQPMLVQTCQNRAEAGLTETLDQVLGDAGFFSEENARFLEEAGLDGYLATERLKHHEEIPPTTRGRCPEGLSGKQRMARKLRTKKGRAVYARRKGIVEPVFGQIKQGLGFRQFLLRGLAKMRAEWRLVCTVHNLLKLWRRAVVAAG